MTNRLTEQQIQEQLLAEFDAIAEVRKKTGGVVKNQISQTKSAEYQRNRRRQKKLNPNQEKVVKTLNPKQKQKLQTLDPAVQDQILNKGLDPNKNLNWFQKAVGAVDTTLNKTLDKVDDITSYDWRRGLSNRSNQDYVGAYGYQKLGKNKKQQQKATATQNKINQVTQQAKKKPAIKTGINNAEVEKQQKLKQKTDRKAAIDKQQKFRNRKQNPTKTKTDIAKKIKIGNQIIDPSDPKNANILKLVNKKTGT